MNLDKCTYFAGYTLRLCDIDGRLLELRYNHNHDEKGRFTFSSGSSSSPKPAKRVDKSGNSGIIKTTDGGLTITNAQFGAKVRRHAKDFGLDPNDEKSRGKLLDIITDIHDNSDYSVEGKWAGQGAVLPDGKNRAEGVVDFHIKGKDVVVSKNNDYITVLKNGVETTGRVKEAIQKAGERNDQN